MKWPRRRDANVMRKPRFPNLEKKGKKKEDECFYEDASPQYIYSNTARPSVSVYSVILFKCFAKKCSTSS